MKLLQFSGKNVRDYLNYNINFRDDITFLIGINGSGKTTALKLISAILLPSYETLSTISFEEIYLHWKTNDEVDLQFKAKHNKENLNLEFIVNNKEPIKSKIKGISIFDDVNDREDKEIEFIQSKVVKAIKEYESPIIMGIDRKLSLGILSSNTFLKKVIQRHRIRSTNNYDYDKIDDALWELKKILADIFRKIAEEQDKLMDIFQQEILEEAMNVIDISEKNWKKYQDFDEQLNSLGKKQDTLNGCLVDLNLETLQSTFDKFFSNTKKWLELLTSRENANEDEYKTALVNWMFNFCQLEKIDNITNLGKEYRNKITKLKTPLRRLTSGLKAFFSEGNKNVMVNGSGELIVEIIRNNKVYHNDIEELSSGEKQIIAILGQLSICDISNSVCIIDEPELSLHISWQEKFIEALKAVGNNTQYIFATHAPAIIADEEWQYKCEDLSENINE